MTNADNEVVDARPAMKTTKAAKLWSERTAAAPCRCSGKKSTSDEAMLSRAPLSTTTTSGGVDHRQWHCGPRGQRSGNPELDGIDACSITIGCRSRSSRTPERVIKPKMRGADDEVEAESMPMSKTCRC
uniref:Uncharacterized protein n=1 Tax=Oryza glumipatula TaxID=40148 RepID=A0A0E0BS46_9ORYZ